MKSITQNLKKLQSKLSKNKKINLVVVTKTRSEKEIEEAIAAGATSIGENRVQEAEKKFPKIRNINKVEKRLIGNLQSNKAKKATNIFDVIDSVDSLRLAKKISDAAKQINKKQRVLIQINSSGEKTKSGFLLEEKEKILKCAENANIEIEGLMTMGPNTTNKSEILKAFKQTKNLFDDLEKNHNMKMKTLSMGMSGDLELAIQEGTTMIRVGTAIFGKRPKIV